MENTGISRG